MLHPNKKNCGANFEATLQIHSHECKTKEVFWTHSQMVENTYAKNSIKSDFHLKLWLLKYSQNSGDCVELVTSKVTTTRKKSAVVVAGVLLYHGNQVLYHYTNQYLVVLYSRYHIHFTPTKKLRSQLWSHTTDLQPLMQNKRGFLNTFTDSREYLCLKRYENRLSFGVVVVDLFTKLWWWGWTGNFKQHHNA